ncbi:MAG: GGDEF domain-containing protein [Oscillospiraceae bacterium]
MVDILNHMRLNAFVCDVETDALLWVSDALRPTLAQPNFSSRAKCHQAVYGLSQRCPFCRKAALEQAPCEGPSSSECYDPHRGQHTIVFECLIPWPGGATAHLEYQININEHQKALQHFRRLSETDYLTQVPNRGGFMAQLEQQMFDAEVYGKPLSLAFIDVDRLKYANDTYGHTFGDNLLLTVVQTLRNHIRSEDILGRVGGDEFIVLFPRCSKAVAARRLGQALNHLRTSSFPPAGEGFSFSFGLAEKSEVSAADTPQLCTVLIDLADKRMQANKARAGRARTRGHARSLTPAPQP